jgi:hypothetical protein
MKYFFMLPWTTLCCKARHHGHLLLVQISNHFRRSPHFWLFQMQLTPHNDLVNRLLPYPDHLSSPHNNPVSECTYKGARPCALKNDHNLMWVWFSYCSVAWEPASLPPAGQIPMPDRFFTTRRRGKYLFSRTRADSPTHPVVRSHISSPPRVIPKKPLFGD